ncbi:hypothetical protein D3C71_1222780 [compost metagenome]
MALAAGQAETAVTQMSLVTIGHGFDKVMGVSDFCRFLYLGQRRVRIAVANVFFNAAEKQRRGLRHQGKTATQVQRVELSQRHAIEQDAPLGRVVKTQQQVIHRGFSGPRWPDQRQRLTGIDGQAQPVDSIIFRPRRVGKTHIVQL